MSRFFHRPKISALTFFSRFSVKGFLAGLTLVMLLGVALSFGRRSLLSNGGSKAAKISNTTSGTAQPISKKEVNQGLSLEIKGKDPIKIKYSIESAEILDEILVKGEKVKATSGRVFLVFSLKITNEGTRGLQINSRDFVRISSPGKEEWLAPEIHNDPVEVQAIATKYTRIGFSINKEEKQFRVKMGELEGEKTNFDLSF